MVSPQCVCSRPPAFCLYQLGFCPSVAGACKHRTWTLNLLVVSRCISSFEVSPVVFSPEFNRIACRSSSRSRSSAHFLAFLRVRIVQSRRVHVTNLSRRIATDDIRVVTCPDQHGTEKIRVIETVASLIGENFRR